MKKWLLPLALALAPSSAFATTENLTQLISDARSLDLDAASLVRQKFSDTQVTNFLNNGQRLAMSVSNCLVKSVNITLSAGTTYYSLPSDFVSVDRVWRVTSGAMLEMSPAALDGRSRGWNEISGTPTYYFIDFSTRTNIGFTPFPAASSDTDTYTVSYNARAADLVNGSDTPFNGVTELTDYQWALAYYAASIMAGLDGLDVAKSYMDIYNSSVQQMAKRCRERPNFRPSAVGVP